MNTVSPAHSFTMIEMVVVIVIIAIVASVVLMRLPSQGGAESELKQWREYFRELAADYRRSAMMTRQQLDIRYDGSRHRWILPREDEEAPEIPKNMTIQIGTEEAPEEEVMVFSFFPDGHINGPTVVMELEKNRLELRPSPLTGALLIYLNTPEKAEEEVPEPLFGKDK